MKRLMNKKSAWLLVLMIAVVGATCGGLWLINRREVSIADVEEPTDEQIEQYLEEYAQVTADTDPENILIVMSGERPEGYGATNIVDAPNHTYYLTYDSAVARDEAYVKLEASEGVNVEKNVLMQTMEYNSWGISSMGLDDVMDDVGYGGEAIVVAVIDTGIDVNLFKDTFPERTLTTYDMESGLSRESAMVDNNGHGTHVAGIIADGTPKNVSIKAIRATRGNSTELYSSDVTNAIYEAVGGDTRVINMSIGSYTYMESQKTAIDYAKDRGIIVVAAAGNDGTSNTLYPAGYNSTLSISAVDSDLSFASYSNYGSAIDFSAPGTSIKSINGVKSGTSMATPHASAAVALLKSMNYSLSFNDAKNLLKEHVRDLGAAGWDQQFGFGMIDFNDADFCDGEYCDEFGVFAVGAPTYARIQIDNVKLTELNYYSVQNLMTTEVKLYSDAVNYTTKKLQDVEDLEISGYDAEASGPQTVRVTCEGVSTTISVTNPEEYPSGWRYDINENDEILLTKYKDPKDVDDEYESVTRIYVPETIDGKTVVALSNAEAYNGHVYPVFYWSDWAAGLIREVYLPATIRSIADETFEYYSTLEKVVMENPNGVAIGRYAFHSDRNLRTVEGKILQVGESAFLDDRLLGNITLAEGMTEIADNAFDGCRSLMEITIPSTVTKIGQSAFSNNYGLSSVTFLGNNLRTIDYSAFSKTLSLSNIVLPDGLEVIEYNTFYDSGLTSVYIPASLTDIKSSSFALCGKLTTIVVDEDNTVYYDVNDKVLMYDNYSYVILLRGTKNFDIPANTTTISTWAFSGIDTVGVLVLPDTIEGIGSRAFFQCVGLRAINIPKETTVREGAFARRMDSSDSYVASDVQLAVYSDSPGQEYAVDEEYVYDTIDASYARVTTPFNYGESVANDTEIEFYYDYGSFVDGEYVNHTGTDGKKVDKTGSDLISVDYLGEGDCFRIGDTSFTANYKDYFNDDAGVEVEVTVNGELPTYEVPTGLEGKLRESLRTVELPEGFSWMDEPYMNELGEQTYLARYTPADTSIYAPIDNIEVTVTVVPGRVKLPDPVITLTNKPYDGGYELDDRYVSVSIEGLDPSQYYYYAHTYDSEVGVTTASVTVYLEWGMEDDYGFGDDYNYYYDYYDEAYEILAPPETCEVSFNSHGGSSVLSQTVAFEGKAERPDDPTWEGHVFMGWYEDSDYYDEFDFDTAIMTETEIHAKWAIAISSANITIDAPTVGGHPDFSLDGDSEHYYISFDHWCLYDSTLDYPELNSESVFENNMSYGLYFTLSTYDGYAFTDDAVYTVNGEEADRVGGRDGTSPYILYYVTLNEAPVIEHYLTSANILIDAPVLGGHPDMTPVVDGEHYRVEFESWVLDDSDTYPVLSADSVFEAGNYYELSFSLYTDDGYGFTNDAVYTVNGESAWRAGGSGATYIFVRYRFLMEAVELDIDNQTGGIATVQQLADGVKVTAEKACAVIITRDGGSTYSKVPAVAVGGEENTYKFAFEITADTDVMVVLKGDLDMRGTLNARDSAKIDYHLLSNDNLNHRTLTALEMLIADVNNSGTVTARDGSLLDYAILSADNPNYRALSW